MELVHQFSGHLNVDNSVEETDLGEDYFYAYNIQKDSNVSNDNKVESQQGCIAVSNLGYIDGNSVCVGVIESPKDDIGYLFFYNSVASKQCILQLAPVTLTYSITGAVTNGTTTITYAANSNISVGDIITGTNIPVFTIVTQVLSSTSCVLSQPATGSGSGLTLAGGLTTNTISLVINWSGLAFTNTRATRIYGFVLGGNIYYTDQATEPKCVNLTRYAGGATPTNVEEIYMLKRAPRYAPYTDFQKGQNSGYGYGKWLNGTAVNNNIYQDTQFAIQYQYADGQLSVLSPYSSMVRKLKENEVYNTIRVRLVQDLFSVGSITTVTGTPTVTIAGGIPGNLYPGVYVNDQSGYTIFPQGTRVLAIIDSTHFSVTNNALQSLSSIALTFQNQIDSIPYLVTQINLYCRIGQTGSFIQVGQVTRNLGGSFSANYIDYKGITVGGVLDAHYLQQFENLPQKIGTMCAAGSRSWIGNYTDGYTKYDPSNVSGFTTQFFEFLTSPNPGVANARLGFTSFSPYSNYKIGFVLRDVNLRVMGVVSDPSWTLANGISTFGSGSADAPSVVATLAATLTGLPAWCYDVGVVITKDTNKSFFIEDFSKNPKWVAVNSVTNNGVTTLVQTLSTYYPTGGIVVNNPLAQSANTCAGLRVTTYTNVSPTATSGSGTNALFTIVVDSATTILSCVCTFPGKGYAVGQTVSFNATLISQGTGTGYVSFTIGAVTSGAKYYAVDVSGIVSRGIGYVWQQGDRLLISGGGLVFGNKDLSIESFDGTYVYCSASALITTGYNIDIGGAGNYFSMIYRPIVDQSAVSNLFYELPFESWYSQNVLNPAGGSYIAAAAGAIPVYNYGSYFLNIFGTAQVNSIIDGDCLLTSSWVAQPTISNDYLATRTYSPKGNTAWNTSSGRPFVVTRVDLAQKNTWVRYGGTYVSGTNINQLAEFSAASEQNISPNAGTVQRLFPTVRDSSQSSAILAICNTDTYTIYINESVITTSTANQIVSATVNVIGDVRQQQSGFGTLHPESIVMDRYGSVFWFDTLQRSYVKYASNGIYPISFNKMSSYFYYQALANPGNEYVFSAYDPFNETIYVLFSNVHGAGNVNGDVTKKTIGYNIFDQAWQGFYGISMPASGGGIFSGSKNMYSFLPAAGSYLWKHCIEGVSCYIQGTQYNSAISFSLVPKDKTSLHDWKVLRIQGSPNFFSWSNGVQVVNDSGLFATLTNKNGQQATLSNARSGEKEFEAEENVIYAVIKFDENSINKLTNAVDSSSCLYGDTMTSNTIQVALRWTGGTYKYIRTVSIGYEPSRGHYI
jgi:hypothetical protein